MEIEHLKSYLYQVKGYLEGGEQKLATDPIDEIIKCLEEGKKYKKMWRDFRRKYKDYFVTRFDEEGLLECTTDTVLIEYNMNVIEQEYFSKGEIKC